MAYDTALNLISRAAVQCGLGPVADAYGSTDPNVIQLREFLATLGDDLARENNWPQLVKEYTFTTTSNQTTQALPTDFHDIVDQTTWNRSSRLPMIGPLSGQEAAYLKARFPALVVSVPFRILGSNMVFPVSPAAGGLCAFEYISSQWVASAGATSPDKEAPTVNTDVIWYDPILIVRGLKVAWLTAKGYDTAVAVDEYEKTLEHCIAKGSGAPVLSMGNAGRAVDRFLDGNNIPITGYGNGT